jgi:hypothetical protein
MEYRVETRVFTGGYQRLDVGRHFSSILDGMCAKLFASSAAELHGLIKVVFCVALCLCAEGAYAQDPNDPGGSPAASSSAPAAASSDDLAKPEKPMHKHHHHMTNSSGNTDENADKLNACMSNATPTSQQESCLRQAAGTGNG